MTWPLEFSRLHHCTASQALPDWWEARYAHTTCQLSTVWKLARVAELLFLRNSWIHFVFYWYIIYDAVKWYFPTHRVLSWV